jgi:hypothetical protein
VLLVVAGQWTLVLVEVLWIPDRRSVANIGLTVGFQTFSVVGGYLTIRRPRHPIGPLFMLTGVCSVGQALADAIVERAQREGDVAGVLVHLAAGLQTWVWLPALAIPMIFIPLLFPDGRPLSNAWRWAVRAGGVAVGLVVLSFGTVGLATPTSELLQSTPQLHGWRMALSRLAALGLMTCLICAVLGVAALAFRYRRGDQATRQQIKLVLLGVAAAVAAVVAGGALGAQDVGPAATGLVAVAVAVAVLRYRLYDIDRIVSRTLSYALVTALVVGTYVAAIALADHVVGVSSSFAVAASTLVAAAAFQPLRRRMQGLVDRRFNRAAYDARRLVAAFSARLRDEVDVDAIRGEFLETVTSAVAPASASVWALA